MATYYVKTTGDDSTGDGSEGSPWASPGYGASQLADGDTLYVETGTYTITTETAGSDGPVVASNTITVLIEGYESTGGDKCPNDNFPIVKMGTPTLTDDLNMFYLDTHYEKIHQVNCIEIDGDDYSYDTYNVGGIGGGNYGGAYRCVVHNMTSSGITADGIIRCLSYDNSGVGFNGGTVTHCRAHGNNDHGFLCVSDPAYCIADNNGNMGFYISYAKSGADHCVAYNNGAQGFRLSYVGYITNCVSYGNATYGFTSSATLSLYHCATGDNTSGKADVSLMNEISPITLSGNPFTSTGNADLLDDDFTPNDTAGAGAALRAAGIGVYNHAGNIDVGSVQHEDAGGGGGTTIPQGLHNIEAGVTA